MVDGSTEADVNIVVMVSAIPWLGSVVVGALCLTVHVSISVAHEDSAYECKMKHRVRDDGDRSNKYSA
jgi:hypothetical protein